MRTCAGDAQTTNTVALRTYFIGLLELELEFCNLFLIISKHRGRGSEMLAPVYVKFYWLSNDISFVKIRILCFAVDRHKVRHVMFIQGFILASMKKLHAGEGSVEKNI